MNTFIHILAITAVFRASRFFFDRSEDMYGLVAIGVAMLLIVWTIQAFAEDLADYRRKRKR